MVVLEGLQTKHEMKKGDLMNINSTVFWAESNNYKNLTDPLIRDTVVIYIENSLKCQDFTKYPILRDSIIMDVANKTYKIKRRLDFDSSSSSFNTNLFSLILFDENLAHVFTHLLVPYQKEKQG